MEHNFQQIQRTDWNPKTPKPQNPIKQLLMKFELKFRFYFNGRNKDINKDNFFEIVKQMLKSIALAITALAVPIHATKFNFENFFYNNKPQKPA